MAHSINALSVSGSSNNISYPDGKKSLFLLKKITTLAELEHKVLKDDELNNTDRKVGDLINISLNPSPNLDSIKLGNIKKELQGLKLVLPALTNYSLEKVSHAALSELTGAEQSSLSETQEIHFNQIYTEQFLTWIQEEIEHLPGPSILLLLPIYHSFSDPSINLETSIWQELLSLKGWNTPQIKSLNQFKSKYESLSFPFVKIENTILLAEATGDIKKLKDLYMLWNKLVEVLVNHLDEDQKKHFVRSLNKNKKFIREEGKTPDKEFIIHAKKMIGIFLFKLEQARKENNEKISSSFKALKFMQNFLKEEEEKIQNTQKEIEGDLQNSLKDIDDQMQKIQRNKSKGENYLQKLQQLKESGVLLREEAINAAEKEKGLLSSIKTKDLNFQRLSELREEVIEKIQESKQEHLKILRANNPIIELSEIKEKDKKEIHHTLTLREKGLSSILFLSQWLVNLLEKEEQLINQLEQEKCIAYEAAIKKTESSFKKHSIPSKKTLAKSSSFVEDFSITSENTSEEELDEELSISSSSSSIACKIDSFNEINRYLAKLGKGKNIQINGLLSQAVNSLLKTLKAHLLKTKAVDDLKELYGLQTKETYDHLLLGAAGLELTIQAVHDQRIDHSALGFRATLLHCYYAMEQKLSQRIILETNKILDKEDQNHNLLHLAQKAKIADIKKWEWFLQEMTLHLTFSYPEDYRLFFQQGNEQKAFALLNDLSGPNLDKKKIEEALEFCFEMYSKSIAFITEVSSVQIEDQPKFLHIMQKLKKQIISTLYESSVEKILLAQTSVLQLKEPDPVLVRVQQMLGVLHPFLKDFDLLNSCERDQKIYAAISTIESCLKWMKISLEIPENSSQHSLQKFIKLETIANIDKLFKHLFRAVILLENGEDNHQHILTNLFPSVANFYQRDNKKDIDLLKEINLGINHHYFHITWNNSELRALYKESLAQAYSLKNVFGGKGALLHRKIKKSAQNFQKNIDTINELVRRSLDLFGEFLEPTLAEIKKRLPITAVA